MKTKGLIGLEKGKLDKKTKKDSKSIDKKYKPTIQSLHLQQELEQSPTIKQSTKRLKKTGACSDDQLEEEIQKKLINSDSQKEEQNYERFQKMDDEDWAKQRKQEEEKLKNKGKRKNKTKSKDVGDMLKQNKSAVKEVKAVKKKEEAATKQQLLLQMFKTKPIQNKPKQFQLQFNQDNDDSSSADVYRIAQQAKLNLYNGDYNEQQAEKIAIKESLEQLKEKDNIKDNLDQYAMDYKQKKDNLDQYAMDYNVKKNKKTYGKRHIVSDSQDQGLGKLIPEPVSHQQKIRKYQDQVAMKTSQKSAKKQIFDEEVNVDKGKKSVGKKATKSLQKLKHKKQQRIGVLAKQCIVFSGNFEPYNQSQIQQVLRNLGAQAYHPGKLPQKATILFVGDYVTGIAKVRTNDDPMNTQKVRAAQSKGIPIIKNSEIDDFLFSKTGKTLRDYIQQGRQADKKAKEQFKEVMDIQKKIPQSKAHQLILQNFQPWTTKYAPKALDEIIGQSQQIKMLKNWLEEWQQIHIRGNKQQVAKNKGFLPSGDINSSAALLSGDPGLGKTTTARLLAQEMYYDVVEFNASDIRNKSSINILQKTSMGLSKMRTLQKQIVIMDEVDGMSSGDRGGITAIIDMIKKTKIPIICICNDRQAQKIRSLAGHCLDVKFHKPDKRQIVARLKEILDNQGVDAHIKAIQRIVEIFQNDIRKILSYLQFYVKNISKRISLQQIQMDTVQSKESTVMVNQFESARKLMNRNTMNLRQKLDCFFVDSDLMPLMVHENLWASASKRKMNRRQFHNIVEATESLVISDMLNKKIKKQQQYGLMPSYGIMSAIYPIEKVSEMLGFPQFPAFLGKFSSERKNKRLIKQLKQAISPVATVTNKSAKFPYSTMLFKEIHFQLKNSDNIDEIVDFMDNYNINPNIMNQHLVTLQYNPQKLALMADIPTSKKTKLTKNFNKRHEIRKQKAQKAKVKMQHAKYNMQLDEMEEDIVDEPEQEQEDEQNKQEINEPVKKKGTKGKK